MEKEKEIVLQVRFVKLDDVKFINTEHTELIHIKPLGIPDGKCIILELEKKQYSIKEVTAIIEKMRKEKNKENEWCVE